MSKPDFEAMARTSLDPHIDDPDLFTRVELVDARHSDKWREVSIAEDIAKALQDAYEAGIKAALKAFCCTGDNAGYDSLDEFRENAKESIEELLK